MREQVMLLHGLPGHGKQWKEHRTMLREFDVQAPTFGGFEGFPCAFPATDDHALEIVRWTEDLGPDDLTIVAWSFSCHPLLMAMTKYELRPRRVIFYEPSSATYLVTAQQQRFQADAIAAFAPLLRVMGELSDEDLVQEFFASTGGSRAWQEIDEHARGVYVAAAPALRSAFDGTNAPTAIDATALSALHGSEVHVVSGSDTREMFRVACEGLVQAIPGCYFHLVEGADHLQPATRPAEFCQFIREVLKGKSGASS